MLLSRLAETRTALAATRSRNAKRDLIADVLRDTSTDDVEIVVAYLSGGLRQRRTGVGWRTLQNPPPPAETPSLTVAEVDQAFAEMAELSGPGSASARAGAVGALLGRATAEEQHLLFGLVSGELRQGAMEAAVQDGLAVAYGVPLIAVRRAAMLLSSTTGAAAVLLRRGAGRPGGGGAPGGDRDSADARCQCAGPGVRDRQVWAAGLVDHKLDGVRVQVHRDGETIRVFTRSLDDITGRLPGVAEVVNALPYARLVLDGEVLALGGDGRPEAFQVVASRTMSENDPSWSDAREPTAGLFLRSVARRRQGSAGHTAAGTAGCDGRRPAGGDLRAPADLRHHRGGGGALHGRGHPRLRGSGHQEPRRPVRRRPPGFGLGQDQAPAHLRSGGHRGGVGSRPPAGLAVQPAPGRQGPGRRGSG